MVTLFIVNFEFAFHIYKWKRSYSHAWIWIITNWLLLRESLKVWNYAIPRSYRLFNIGNFYNNIKINKKFANSEFLSSICKLKIHNLEIDLSIKNENTLKINDVIETLSSSRQSFNNVSIYAYSKEDIWAITSSIQSLNFSGKHDLLISIGSTYYSEICNFKACLVKIIN